MKSSTDIYEGNIEAKHKSKKLKKIMKDAFAIGLQCNVDGIIKW